MDFKKYKLSELLIRKKEKIKLDNDLKYKRLTIRLNHKGVILRDEEFGYNIKSSMFKVNNGDFVLSGIDARNGAFGIVPEELDGSIVTNDFWCLIPNERLLNKHFFLFLTSTSFFDYICKLSSDGTTQRIRLQKDKFFNYQISIPTINEQNTLVEKLNKINVDNLTLKKEIKTQLSLISQLRQAFLKDAMQGKLVSNETSDGKTGTELLAEIKTEKEKLSQEKKIKKGKPLPPISEEEIPFEIPENWVWCRLGEVCNYGTNPKIHPEKINEDCWSLDLEDIEKITSKVLSKVRYQERKSTSTKNIFKKAQVLYSKLRPNLDKVIVADEDGVCTTEIIPINFYRNLNSYYFRFYLKSSFFIEYVVNSTKGMKMPRVGTEEVRTALHPLPPLEIQNRIVSKLDEVMNYCDDLETAVQESQNYNEQLLQQVLREALEVKEVAKI